MLKYHVKDKSKTGLKKLLKIVGYTDIFITSPISTEINVFRLI